MKSTLRVLIVGEGKHENSGALKTLVLRAAGEDWVCDVEKVSREGIHTFHGKGSGYLKKALAWMIEAEKRGYDAIVFLIDEDGDVERRKQLDRTQEYSAISLPRAMGIAVRSFDAWMLADEQALSNVLGITIQTQPSPETIDDPKRVCRELLNKCGKPMSQTDLYTGLASVIRLKTLEARCHDGFAPFAKRVRKLFRT